MFVINLKVFLFSIKETERDLTESDNGCDLRSSELIFSGKPQQRLFGFFIFIEYERECFQATLVVQQFRFHKIVRPIAQ